MPRMSEILKMQIWSCYCPLKNSPMNYQYQSELTRLYVIDLAHAFSFVSHHLTPTHPLFFLCFRRVIFYFLNIVCGSGPLHYQVSLPRRFFFLGKWRLLHTRTHLSCPPPPPHSLLHIWIPCPSPPGASRASSLPRLSPDPSRGNASFLDSSKHYWIQ